MAKLNVVLYQPEIPQNTGNIMRSCLATDAKLHIIEPCGFSFDEKSLRRASINFIHELDYEMYPDWETFLEKNKEGQFHFITRYGTKPHSDANFKIDKDIYLLFGNESSGTPHEILSAYKDDCYRLPMATKVRSVNLSNTVMTVLYEALRQNDYFDLDRYDTYKGEDFLK